MQKNTYNVTKSSGTVASLIMAHVSKLLLAETHKLQTVQCTSGTSCQQLVQQQLLLYGLHYYYYYYYFFYTLGSKDPKG